MIKMTDNEKIVTLKLAIRCSLWGLIGLDASIVPTLERNWDNFDDGFKAFIKREVKRVYDHTDTEGADYQTLTNNWIKFLGM